MIRLRQMIAAATALCIGLSVVSPAMAQWHHGPGWGPPGPAWGGPPPPHYYHHPHHDGDVALGVGLGILGLGVVAALASQPVIYQAPPPGYYVAPGRPIYAAPTSEIYIASDGRQCREYQTTVMVEGRAQAAYGTACLGPDGVWRIVQ